jgi:hypothetical protein
MDFELNLTLVKPIIPGPELNLEPTGLALCKTPSSILNIEHVLISLWRSL